MLKIPGNWGWSLLPISLLLACTGPETPSDGLSGEILIDGSSTVYPVTAAVAEEFRAVAPNVEVPVGVSGTGGGFERFCRGETEISNASRPIKSSEIEVCTANGIEFIELPVAFDGLSVMVNPENDWVDCMTVEELKMLWDPEAEGSITRWSQIRPEWPDDPITLAGPGVDSGTYDYFTAAIVGEEGASRGDFLASEDDNVLVQAIAGDRLALGFFGYAYYVQNTNRLKLLAIDDSDDTNGAGCIAPSPETINTGTYQPLARPIFIYVSLTAANRPEVEAFVRFYLTEGRALVDDVGYVPLPDRVYELTLERFENRITGTLFAGGSELGVTLEELLARESE